MQLTLVILGPLLMLAIWLMQTFLNYYSGKHHRSYRVGRPMLVALLLVATAFSVCMGIWQYYDSQNRYNQLFKKYDEEKLLDRQYKENMIRSWRQFLSRPDNSSSSEGSFLGSVEYSEMRPFLSQETIDSLENSKITVRMGRGGPLLKCLILDDISRLERKWGLIKDEGLR